MKRCVITARFADGSSLSMEADMLPEDVLVFRFVPGQIAELVGELVFVENDEVTQPI